MFSSLSSPPPFLTTKINQLEVIQSLLSKTNSAGSLAAFLPASDLRFPPVTARLSQNIRPVLPSGPRFEPLDYSLDRIAKDTNHGSMSRLEFISQSLIRYQYALTDTGELDQAKKVCSLILSSPFFPLHVTKQ